MSIESLKARHAWRVSVNQRNKTRDRYKPKGWVKEFLPLGENRAWRHMSGEQDYQFNRRKAPPETGYGVAYEPRRDVS